MSYLTILPVHRSGKTGSMVKRDNVIRVNEDHIVFYDSSANTIHLSSGLQVWLKPEYWLDTESTPLRILETKTP